MDALSETLRVVQLTGAIFINARFSAPLLKEAGRVTVVEIAAEKDLSDARTRLRDVVGWLKRHGIEATPVAALSTGDDAVGLKAIPCWPQGLVELERISLRIFQSVR